MSKWMLLLALAGWPLAAMAALDLDPDFGDGGLVTHAANGPTDESIVAARIDSQDRIVSAYGGFNARGVSRHLADGSLDAAFGDGGRAALDFGVRDLGIQADGRIVAVGINEGSFLEQDWQIARLMPDGSIDTSFGDQGRISLDWYGSSDEARSIAFASGGHIVVGGRAYSPGLGSAFAIATFDGQGQLVDWRADKFFTGTADICNQVLVQPDDKIICAGLARNPGGAVMVAARYEPDLSGDDGFGTDGAVAVAYSEGPAEAQAAMLLPGGEILLGGFVDDSGDYALALVRLTASGALDTGFGSGGRAQAQVAGSETESINDLFLDGARIFASVQGDGLGDFVVAAFTLAGTLDGSFGTSGLATVDFDGLIDRSHAIASHQGQVLVAGAAQGPLRSQTNDLALARLTSSGALDTSFGYSGRVRHGLIGPVNVWVTDAVVKSDGGVLAIGYVGMNFSAREFSLTAFNADGSIDVGFGNAGSQTIDFDNDEDHAHAIALLADGRFLVAGTVRSDGGSLDFGVARFLADGTLDTSFGNGGWAVIDLDGDNDTARDLIVQPDGRILVAGEAMFPSHGYTTDFVVVRLEADGSLDAGFGTSGVASHSVNNYDWTTAVALLAGGQIVVGGHSDKKYTFVRFTSNGSLDAGFGTGGVVQVDFAGELDVLQDLIVLDDWQGQGERIVAVGSARTGSSVTTEDFAAVMLTGNGALEPGFGSGGKVTFDFDSASDQAFSVTETASGGLVLAGRATLSNRYGFAALALGASGTPDSSFFQTGASFTQNFTATSHDSVAKAIARDGSLTLAGISYDQSGSGGLQKVALARLAASTRIFSDRFEQP